jgi:hypothetical protein
MQKIHKSRVSQPFWNGSDDTSKASTTSGALVPIDSGKMETHGLQEVQDTNLHH